MICSFVILFFGHYRSPVTTGTSVVGVQFKDGVMLAADVLASYGSLARYRDVTRVLKVNENIVLGAGGDYADYQYIKNIIEQKMSVKKVFSFLFS